MATTDRQAATLEAVRATIKTNHAFRVFVQHAAMPIPMSTSGPAEMTAIGATRKAERMLSNPVFTQAWVIGRDGVTEVEA